MKPMAFHVRLLLILSSLCYTTAASGQVTFTPLGDLPGGGFLSNGEAISADGSVVVGGSESASGVEAFRWTRAGGMVGLGNLPDGRFTFAAFGASADGSVVVGEANGPEAFRWTAAGGFVDMGGIPFGQGTLRGAEAKDVSADGAVVVGTTSPFSAAFRWTQATGMVALHEVRPGGPSTRVWAVSGDGSVIVGQFFSPNREAFRWTEAGGVVGLGHLPGPGEFKSSNALGISANGSVIVGATTAFLNNVTLSDAFRWTSETGMIRIGPGEARDVSADGSAIVGLGGSGGAFYWTESLGWVNLRDYLTSHGANNLASWTLEWANSISDDGLTITGLGVGPRGREAWVATIPEPATFALAGVAAWICEIARMVIRRRSSRRIF